MKVTLFLWSLLFFSHLLAGQSMQKYKQAGVSYKVPNTYASDPFGDFAKGNWNEYGSSVCDCAGIIHIDDRNRNRERFIAFFPSEKEYVVERESVWGYLVEEVEKPETIMIGEMQFTRVPLFYTNEANQIVYSGYRYTTEMNGYFYIFHAFVKNQKIAMIPKKFLKQMEEEVLPSLKVDKKF